MSAQRIPSQTADGLETLKELLELAKNPKAIVEAAETARKQDELTESEREKTKEARAFLKQYDAALVDMAVRRQELEDAKSELAAKEAGFNAFHEAETARLLARDGALDTLQKQLNQQEAKIAIDAKSLSLDRQKTEEEIRTAAENLRKELAGVEKDREALDSQKVRLDALERELKIKAARMRESAEGL